MKGKSKRFESKFLSKIRHLDPAQIHDYVGQLLSRKNFLERIFDHLGEGIIVTDGELRILYYNMTAAEMLRWPRDSRLFGDDLIARCPDLDLAEAIESLVRNPRKSQSHEFAIGEHDERRLILNSILMQPPEAPDEETAVEPPEAAWVFLLHDVTERYRTMEEHARAQRLASLSLLTAGVAHEIKNPLNSLNIHAQILLRQAELSEEDEPLDRDQVARAARVILEETERLTGIVNEFIQAARPQGPLLERYNLNRVCEDLVRVVRPECEEAGIELQTDLDPDLPEFTMDRHLLFQAIRNLLRNAIEAHVQEAEDEGEAPGAERPRGPRMILLRTRLAGDTIGIEVADNGPGIPEDRINRIFEPYYSTKFNGTGLGLMVVYRVVTEHKGSIHVDSRPGVGTRFIITLPLTERPIRLLEQPAAITVNPS